MPKSDFYVLQLIRGTGLPPSLIEAPAWLGALDVWVRPRETAAQGGGCGGRTRLATSGAPIALLHSALHATVPLSALSSGRPLGVVAKSALRVYQWPPLDVSLLSQANQVPQDARRGPSFQALKGLTTVHSPGIFRAAV
jgi:hypothetical protein